MTTSETRALETRVEKLEGAVDAQTKAVNNMALELNGLSAHFEHIITTAQVDERIKEKLKLQFSNCNNDRNKINLWTTIKNVIFIAGISGTIVVSVLTLWQT